MYSVSEDAKSKFYEKFDTNEEKIKKDVQTIKEWIKTQTHLPEIMEDVKIRNFLSLNDFRVDKTKRRIENYYTVRTLIPEMFENSNPKLENMQKGFDQMYICSHPKPHQGLKRIYIVKPKQPNFYLAEEEFKILFATYEVRLYEDFFNDEVFIFDMSTMTLNDMMKLTPRLLHNAVAVLQKVYSLRMMEIHYINAPPFITLLMGILQHVVKSKIFQRIKVHSDCEVLKEYFSEEDLPVDFGGKGQSLEELTEMTRKKLAEYQERFDLLDGLKVDESLRKEEVESEKVLGFFGRLMKHQE